MNPCTCCLLCLLSFTNITSSNIQENFCVVAIATTRNNPHQEHIRNKPTWSNLHKELFINILMIKWKSYFSHTESYFSQTSSSPIKTWSLTKMCVPSFFLWFCGQSLLQVFKFLILPSHKQVSNVHSVLVLLSLLALIIVILNKMWTYCYTFFFFFGNHVI